MRRRSCSPKASRAACSLAMRSSCRRKFPIQVLSSSPVARGDHPKRSREVDDTDSVSMGGDFLPHASVGLRLSDWSDAVRLQLIPEPIGNVKLTVSQYQAIFREPNTKPIHKPQPLPTKSQDSTLPSLRLSPGPATRQYNTIQYNTIQYNTIQYNTIQYNTAQYNTLDYTSLHHTTLHYTTLLHTTLHYTTTQYNTIKDKTIQYSTAQYNEYVHTCMHTYITYITYTAYVTYFAYITYITYITYFT